MSKAAKTSSNSNVGNTREEEVPSPGVASGQDLMQSVLSRPSRRESGHQEKPGQIEGIVIGTLTDLGSNGRPMVRYNGVPGGEAIEAISTEKITKRDLSQEVALSFVEGNPLKPVILGLVRSSAENSAAEPKQDFDVQLDGEKLTMTAEKEIVLKCGEASITLTRAGKIIIKGAYLSNHSKGVNRIKGGSVQIN